MSTLIANSLETTAIPSRCLITLANSNELNTTSHSITTMRSLRKSRNPLEIPAFEQTQILRARHGMGRSLTFRSERPLTEQAAGPRSYLTHQGKHFMKTVQLWSSAPTLFRC